MTGGRARARSGLTVVETALVLAITAGVLATVLHLYGLVFPWRHADFTEATDVSNRMPSVFASAVLQGDAGRRDRGPAPVVLTAVDSSGRSVRVELSRMAAYVLAHAGKDRR